MGIQVLEIDGFRSLRSVTWQPGRLNVVIGPNGSGKSNLLRALELLRNSAAGTLPEDVLREGGIAPLLWDDQVPEIRWRLRAQIEKQTYAYLLEIQRLGKLSSYRVSQETLEALPGLALLHRDQNRKDFLDRNGARIELGEGVVTEDQPMLAKALFPVFAAPQSLTFHKFLDGWAVYHDLRVDREAAIRYAAVSRFETKIAANGGNLVPVLHTLYTSDRDFKNTVDSAMRAAFGTDYEEIVFPPAADQLIQLRLRWRALKTAQPTASLSDGTLRFLLLAAILANPAPGQLIAIDEPETGLHPSMFPIIAELAVEASERTQVVFTTHSPQFLDAFSDSSPTTTVAEWLDGETHLSVLEGDELQRWLRHYSLGTLFRSGELEALA